MFSNPRFFFLRNWAFGPTLATIATKIIKPTVSNGKTTTYKSTTFAHPNIQSTSLVSKIVTYKSTILGTLEVVDYTMKTSIYLQPTIYDPPPLKSF